MLGFLVQLALDGNLFFWYLWRCKLIFEEILALLEMLALLGTGASLSNNFCHLGKFLNISKLNYAFIVIAWKMNFKCNKLLSWLLFFTSALCQWQKSTGFDLSLFSSQEGAKIPAFFGKAFWCILCTTVAYTVGILMLFLFTVLPHHLLQKVPGSFPVCGLLSGLEFAF